MTHDQREIHRKKRVLEYAERVGNINKTCRYFGVAKSIFYLWRERYRELGEEGLRSRRCGPHNHPNKTPDEVVEKILHLRRTYLCLLRTPSTAQSLMFARSESS
jgi:transposase-like protein